MRTITAVLFFVRHRSIDFKRVVRETVLVGLFASLMLLIAPPSLLSQDLVSLFENHLPEKFVKLKSARKDLNGRLRHYAELDPNLLYLYVEYFNRRFDRKIVDKHANYL